MTLFPICRDDTKMAALSVAKLPISMAVHCFLITCYSCSRGVSDIVIEVDGLIWPLQGSISLIQSSFGFKAKWHLLNVAPPMKLSWSFVMFRPCGKFSMCRSIDLFQLLMPWCPQMGCCGSIRCSLLVVPPTGETLTQMDISLCFGSYRVEVTPQPFCLCVCWSLLSMSRSFEHEDSVETQMNSFISAECLRGSRFVFRFSTIIANP